MKKTAIINALMIVSLLIGVGQNTANALSITENTGTLSFGSQLPTSTTSGFCLSAPSKLSLSSLSRTASALSISYGGSTDSSFKVASPTYSSTTSNTFNVAGVDYSGTLSVQRPLDGSNYLGTVDTSGATVITASPTNYPIYKATTASTYDLQYNNSLNLNTAGITSPKISNTNTYICNQEVAPVLPTPTVNLTVNDSGVAYATYDGSVTLDWESTGMESCNLSPVGQSGTQGHYVLRNITSNITVTANCTIGAGYANVELTPPTVSIKVLPPTYDYLKGYINQLQATNDKKLNFASVLQLIDQSKKANDSGKLVLAQSFLQQSSEDIKKALYAKQLSQAAITKYETASSYLIKTLPIKVELALNGCSVTAKGSPGLTLEYGANYQMKKGYGDQVTIPASGTVAVPIYAPKGYTATGEIKDATGLIYGRSIKNVATGECPSAPIYQDISQHNGYPDKWALPAPQTLIDDWGFYNRTPESYIAFRLAESGRTLPAGYGNVSNWLEKATAGDYIVEVPRPGDIAINTDINNTTFSTAEYVNSVDPDGGMRTSSISSAGDFWGAGVTGGSWYNMKYIRIP